MEENNKQAPDEQEPQSEYPQKPIVVDRDRRKPDTAILSTKHHLRRGSPLGDLDAAPILNDTHEIILVIRGMVERLMIKENIPLVLGRSDMRTRFVPDLDLTPYGALDRGVSRAHAQIHLDADRLYITDLESTNGTFLSGNKLEPLTPALLHKGDELLLGRLAIQILFR